MAEEFFVTLLHLLQYQCIGVGLFLPLEMALPQARIAAFLRSKGVIFLIATSPLTALVAIILEWIRAHDGIQPIRLHLSLAPLWGAIALALWADFQFYVLHRIEHRFFWRFHAVHHSIRNLSAANSYHHWSEALMGLTIGIPLLFIDFEVGPTLGFLTFMFTYQQFYIHSSSRPHFGPLRWLLVDNRYHRIHHSMEKDHHDKNFGAMTPLWDWLFGTLHMPKSNEWPDVGLAELEEPQDLKDWALGPWRYRANVLATPEVHPVMPKDVQRTRYETPSPELIT